MLDKAELQGEKSDPWLLRAGRDGKGLNAKGRDGAFRADGNIL